MLDPLRYFSTSYEILRPVRSPPVLFTNSAYRFPLCVPVPDDRNPTALSVDVDAGAPKLYIPFAAVVDKLAPPTLSVAVAAAVNEPSVRTVVGLSTLKSAGRDAVADVPMPSKFSDTAVVADSERAAKHGEEVRVRNTAAKRSQSQKAGLVRASRRRNQERPAGEIRFNWGR